MEELEKLIEKAQALNENKKYEEVIALLPDAVLIQWNSADLYAEKAQAYYRLKQNDLCEEMADKALAINSEHAKANHYKGNVASDRKDYTKAIEYYEKSIQADPKYAYPYNGLGNFYKEQKEYAKAIEYYEKAIQADPNFAYPYNGLGNVYQEQKEYAKAIEYYEKAIQADPNFAHPYNGLGNVYQEQKEYAKAIEYYEKSIQADPDFAHPYNGLGNVYQEQKEYAKAIEYYEKSIQADPKYAYPYNGLGIVYYEQSEYGKAIKNYERAIELDSGIDAPIYNLANSFFAEGKFEAALEYYKKYIIFNQANPDYYTNWAKEKVKQIEDLMKDAPYQEIVELIENIKELLLFTDTCVTHYTSLTTAKQLVLNSSEFRLSEGAFLNDTSEGRELFKYLGVEITKKRNHETVAEPFSPKPFIGSFVAEKKHDDLTLWRMYGKEEKEEAKGCAITIDMKQLVTLIEKKLVPDGKMQSSNIGDEFKFYKVAYRKYEGEKFLIPEGKDEDVKKLNTYMESLFEKIKGIKSKKKNKNWLNIITRLNEIAYLFKSAEYEYEHELRLVVKGIGFEKKVEDKPKVYIELVNIKPIISKITIGPKVARAEEWASAFYYSYDQDKGKVPEILISHIPFK
jgi:tetratricopeptide (TPR) repeat protein